MRIVIAPDSFKECASARDVAAALADGLQRALPHAQLELVPMADGGEGTVDALISATCGTKVAATVPGPMGEPLRAEYGILGDGETAVIEMAAASGLALVESSRRNPRLASTRGTGELILDALNRGMRKFILGIGGSATIDGGAGALSALGYRLLDAEGRELPDGGAALAHLSRIEASGSHPALRQSAFEVACDVNNPLCGPTGAAHVFGPQKGADAAAVEELDGALRVFGDVVERTFNVNVVDKPGAGAAGGLGAGLVAFLDATLQPGVEIVARALNLEEKMKGADFVITGEGRIDGQTAGGKTPLGVARIAKSLGVPVIAVAGTLGPGCERLHDMGIDCTFSICDKPMTLDEAMASCEVLLRQIGGNIGHLIAASQRPE